jgi:hypothetical protein
MLPLYVMSRGQHLAEELDGTLLTAARYYGDHQVQSLREPRRCPRRNASYRHTQPKTPTSLDNTARSASQQWKRLHDMLPVGTSTECVAQSHRMIDEQAATDEKGQNSKALVRCPSLEAGHVQPLTCGGRFAQETRARVRSKIRCRTSKQDSSPS